MHCVVFFGGSRMIYIIKILPCGKIQALSINLLIEMYVHKSVDSWLCQKYTHMSVAS